MSSAKKTSPGVSAPGFQNAGAARLQTCEPHEGSPHKLSGTNAGSLQKWCWSPGVHPRAGQLYVNTLGQGGSWPEPQGNGDAVFGHLRNTTAPARTQNAFEPGCHGRTQTPEDMTEKMKVILPCVSIHERFFPASRDPTC